MLDSEFALYGDRCPKDFKKISLLGKGGCAVVWLCQPLADEDAPKVALK